MLTNQKKLLLAGGGYADIPLIISAKKLGYYVISSGNRAEDLGHKYSDEYCPADFSDPDAILRLASLHKVSAICACCNDFSALSSAFAAERLGLPGHDPFETSKILHHKDSYRSFATNHNIATPQAMGFDSRDEALKSASSLTPPLIIKPVDLTGGKGVTTITNLSQLETAIDKAFSLSRAKRIVIEEFISGSRHGFSCFIVDGRVVFYFSDNEHYFLNQYMVSAASTPGNVPVAAERKLCDYAVKISELLSLKTGIFHIQYILKGDDPVIIEICRRAPGDLYIKLVEHATGVDYPSWIVKSSAGLDCSDISHREPTGFFTRHCIMSASAGTVKGITYDKSVADNIIDSFIWGGQGDTITDVMTSKLGIVFLKFQSSAEMLDKTERMQDLIKVVTE